MKKFFFFVAIALLCASCNTFDGPVITEDLNVGFFDAVEVIGHADILFSQDDAPGATLRTREDYFDKVDVYVKGTTLVIDTRKRFGFSFGMDEVSLRLYSPRLKRIDIDGAARFELADGLISDDDLKVHIDGAAELDLVGISVRDLDVRIDGAGEVYLDGEADNAYLEIDGAGRIDARYLEVFGELRRHIAGIGEILL